MALLLNCDLGENASINGTDSDSLVMPHIHLVNIACGMHAGTPEIMKRTLNLAKAHGVGVGAHPGYADRKNFGRVSIPQTRSELLALLQYQIGALEGMTTALDMSIDYIKPHGALYHDMMANDNIRQAIMTSIAEHPRVKRLMIMATPRADTHREEAARLGIELIFEAFADRCYDDKGSLLPRGDKGALHNRERTLQQVLQLRDDHSVTTATGKQFPVYADTLCIHGDHEGSVSIIRAISTLLAHSR